MKPSPTESTADREIVTTRTVAAPRELVWRVWTDPQHVLKWWGPSGFSTTTTSMDVRAGGHWHFTMHGPDGRDYLNRITYHEVQPPARLVYQHGGGDDAQPIEFVTTVTFDELPGEPRRTRVTLRAVFATAAARDRVLREFGAAEGGQQTLARLAELAESMARDASATGGTGAATTSPPLVLRRVVRATPEQVWRVWTEREHLAQWFGPAGCTLDALAFTLRAGGTFHYRMRMPGAGEMYGRWVFREVAPPTRLVFTVGFADAAGAPARSPFDASWPLEMLTVVTIEPHAGIGKGTVLTVTSSAIAAHAAEQRTFDGGHASMQQGWAGTFDRLDQYVASPS